jgi:hypothetical protein
MVFDAGIDFLKNVHIGHAAVAHNGKMAKRAAKEKRAGEFVLPHDFQANSAV